MTDDCIFCRIGRGEIPVEPIFENADIVAFRDRQPQAPEHALLIPRSHYETLMDIDEPEILGKIMLGVQEVARRLQLEEEGFRIVINCRDNGGQTVYHLHVHILGGRFMQWPPG